MSSSRSKYTQLINFDLPNTYAIDTETTLFRERRMDANRKTYLEPFGGHRLVLGSIAGDGKVVVCHKDDFLWAVANLLEHTNQAHLVFHNAAFDIHTILAAAPHLKRPFCDAIRAGRVHDTRILEILCRIASGIAGVSADLFKNTTLENLALRYAGLHLMKDTKIRCGFDQFEDPGIEIPEKYLRYAAQDAEATLKVYKPLLNKARQLAVVPDCRYPVHKDAESKFGVLGEKVEVMGDIGLAWLQQFPVRVDLNAAKLKCAEYESLGALLEDQLINYGYASRQKGGKYKGRFKLSYKKLRETLTAFAKDHGIQPEFTDSGLISLKYDDWSKHIDKDAGGPLATWMKYSRNRKMLTTYLYVYSAAATHYPEYFSIGARTTRTACRRPNIQNVPKRRDSLRAMFIPSPGRVFIETDYCAAELVALAQIWYMMFGESHLRKAINAGQDPHADIARRLFPEEWKAADAAGRKELRQPGKAVNFGLPGGLGARTFSQFSRSYGLDLDADEAKELRARAMAAEPCLAAYLADERSLESRLCLAAKNIGIPFASLITALNAWRNRETGTYHARAAYKRLRRWARGLDHDRYNLSPKPGFNPAYDLWASPSRILTGAVRGGCSYTNGHNTPFQGAVAAAAKMAAFGIWQSWGPDSHWAPVNFVHDSFLVEAEPSSVDFARQVVEDNMVQALEQICPDVRCSVESEVKERWGR